MALQDKLGSAEKLNGQNLGNIALALFSTAVQANSFFLNRKQVAEMEYENCFLHRKIVVYML